MSDFDFDRAAAAMFGGTTPTAASSAPTSAPVTDEQALADKLYPTKPTAHANATAQRDDRPITELTEAEQAQRMYGATDPTLTHRDATQAIVNASVEEHLHDPETAQEIASEWAATFQLHNLSSTESKELADIGASVMANPPTAEMVEAWTETALANLQQEYGTNGAPQALRDAQAYVASVPGAADMLDNLGLGNHPKVVALAAARGRALRLAGKLR